MRSWTPSKVEEVISALWFIVAFCALEAGCPRWLFVPLFIKAGLDSIDAIRMAGREWQQEKQPASPPET
jgi:hypothetical protein